MFQQILIMEIFLEILGLIRLMLIFLILVIRHMCKQFLHKNFLQVLDWNTPAIEFYKGYGAHMDPEWLNASIDF